MLNLFLRCVIIYFFLLIAMRLMGKRQLGELQPFEFAITLVASELACIPMSDPTIPIIYGIIPVFTLFLVHIIMTRLASKSIRFRKVLNGKPVIVIEKGNILPNTLKDLNMTIDDLMEALRGKDCFSPQEVEYGIIETNGGMTVMLKAEQRPVCPNDLNIIPPRAELPVTVIMEGKFLGENLKIVDETNKKRIMRLLENNHLDQSKVMVLMLAGNTAFIQPYDGNSFSAELSNEDNLSPGISIGNLQEGDSL